MERFKGAVDGGAEAALAERVNRRANWNFVGAACEAAGVEELFVVTLAIVECVGGSTPGPSLGIAFFACRLYFRSEASNSFARSTGPRS